MDYKELLELIKRNADKVKNSIPKSEDVVRLAEYKLGVNFPESYRQLLKDVGLRQFGRFELYGIPNNNDIDAFGIPNAIWLTLDERKTSKLPHNLLILGVTDMGEYYALECALGEKDKVYLWEPGSSESIEDLEIVSNSFVDFMNDIVHQNIT